MVCATVIVNDYNVLLDYWPVYDIIAAMSTVYRKTSVLQRWLCGRALVS